jgi:hypothetical protein
MFERRQRQRNWRPENAKLLVPGHAKAIDCVIIDISMKGACLLLPDLVSLPPIFTLVIESDNSVHACRSVWATGNRAGVSFNDVPNIEAGEETADEMCVAKP